MEGDFRHVCETKDKHRFSKQGVLLGGSEARGVFMFSFMQFKHIQLPYTLIWLLQWFSKRPLNSGAVALFLQGEEKPLKEEDNKEEKPSEQTASQAAGFV